MLNLYIDLIKLIIFSYVVQILYALCRSLGINDKALDEVISFESQYLHSRTFLLIASIVNPITSYFLP